MERLTFVDEKGRVLFSPEGCGEDEGYTIIQLAESGYIGLLEEIAERFANYEQRLKEYEELEKQGKLEKIPCMNEEQYTLDQIVDAMVQADGVIILAIKHQDREWVKDVLKEHL